MIRTPSLRGVVSPCSPRVLEQLEARFLLTTYYVSTSGSNANPGTSINQPLRTIQQAVDAAMPGDTVLVRGGTYRETISTPRSGTAAARITIQNYASEAVTVSGADTITGSWTPVGNEVYRAPMPWNYQFENQSSAYNSNQIFVGGKATELARWPNQTSSDVVLPTNAIADHVTFSKSNPALAGNDLATFHDADFNNNPNRWVGAKIWVNLARNDTDGQGQTGEVVSAANGSITVKGIDTRGGEGAWSIGAGTEYYLFQPTISALNATGGIAAGLDRGEWFIDTAAGQLYVRTPSGAAPAANSVEAKRRTYGFNLDADSYINIKGINLFSTTLTTDNLAANRNVSPGGVAAASNILIDGMTARYVSHFTDQTGNYQMQWQQKSGLILSGTRITFQNGDIRLSAGSGMSVIGRQNKVLNSVFQDLNLSGSEAGMVNFGKMYDPGHGAAVSEDHEFGYNTLSRSPQQGINFRALRNSTNDPNDVRARIHHNVIHDVMLRSADSAAMDSFGVNHQYLRIDHNVIYNVSGNGRKYGIYFDFSSHGIVDHNVIYNVTVPININWNPDTGPQNMRIFNNVAISDVSTRGGLETGASSSQGSVIQNNIFSNGIFSGPWPGGIRQTLTGATVSNNLLARSDLFVDATNANMAARNYQLRNTATTAIDQGVSVAPYNDPLADGPDADTTAQPDIGAYEYGTARWAAGAKPVTVTPATASVAGSLYNDANANGVRDAGEASLANWKVYIDKDKDGVFDAGELSVNTDAGGNYKFAGLVAGSYRVREVVNSGWRITTPSSGYYDLILTSGQALTGRTFGNTQRVQISGSVFNDLDGNGSRSSGETALANWRVYLDSDKDGVWDSNETSALSDANGYYVLKPAAGAYRMRVVQPSTGWRGTTPSGGYFDLTLSSGASTSSRLFGFTQKALIGGSVFNDSNGNRIKDAGEAGLSAWRVYLDANNDGVWQSGESSRLSDASGNWSFSALSAGTYTVRVVQQAGWSRTTPTSGYHSVTVAAAQSATGKLFGERRIT